MCLNELNSIKTASLFKELCCHPKNPSASFRSTFSSPWSLSSASTTWSSWPTIICPTASAPSCWTRTMTASSSVSHSCSRSARFSDCAVVWCWSLYGCRSVVRGEKRQKKSSGVQVCVGLHRQTQQESPRLLQLHVLSRGWGGEGSFRLSCSDSCTCYWGWMKPRLRILMECDSGTFRDRFRTQSS